LRVKISTGKILEVFLHPPPPSERERFVRLVGSKIPKANFLSIAKRNCENYLLRIITCWYKELDPRLEHFRK